ncbi:antibiotic biosynthesis monooxygenase [Thalassotalea sp. HSM 43]|uniref:antibiotic biosynthesis monooxygenase family protein n=1 Tax=Thalassotalea sp. HSM 43 TaxID=2552945 RepID=UPI001081B2D5|nr:antibiotic biosynthesis monooxygenase [Thalassotalea sp. HSM 43]QBY04127.1 antibiotic biosynthesis monooxygenase [Thalassotalea sp. HSM 43]
MIAKTPTPPYYAVIFTSTLQSDDPEYGRTAERMLELAEQHAGFLGEESAREQLGITVSYWQDLESIKQWKQQSEHVIAQQMGRKHWYKTYATRICLVERDYFFADDSA